MPRVVDHAERRQQIVFALWLVIAQQGIEGVSLRHVAAEAGVSMGRIQHYFGTKEALVLAGCTALVDSAYGGYQETAEAPPRDRLLHVVSQQIPGTTAGASASASGTRTWRSRSTTTPSGRCWPRRGEVLRKSACG
ncbi:TetR/AcrR family transcriptional regulator [Promicromonospora aerolata]|uniref:TetR/AcrR family transcriptional regulator n=1 Tax=Promicromonospora aerolata TaxID=195749 RepID=A0ABW4V800_9MICO